jgi:hypothetical protein
MIGSSPPVDAAITGTVAAATSSNESSSSCAGPVVIVRQGAGAGISAPGCSLASCEGSQITSRVALPVSRSAIAGGAKAVNSGTYTAPSRQIAITATSNSRLLPISVATRSPLPMPSRARPAAKRSDSARSAP